MKIFLLFTILLSYIQAEYRYVFIMFRHGARAPFFDNDMFNTIWKKEQLLETGKRMHYLAGLKDRELYGGFISDTYKQEEVYSFSTKYNRTIESLEARLQGLYSQDLNKGYELKKEQLDLNLYPNMKLSDTIKSKIEEMGNSALKSKMQIGVQHILNDKEYYDYLENPETCPTSKNYWKSDKYKIRAYEITNPLVKQYKDMMYDVFNLDVKENDFESYEKFFSFCDSFLPNYFDAKSFKILKDNGYTDEFINLLYTNCSLFLKKDMLDYRHGNVDNFYFARLKASSKFQTIISDMDNRISHDNDGKKNENKEYSLPKLKYFSAHDTSLSSFLNALYSAYEVEIIDSDYVLYASEVRVELSIDSENEYRVEIFYNDDRLISTKYSDFRKKVVSQLFISDSEKMSFCGLAQEEKTDWNLVFKGIILFASFISIFLLIYILFKSVFPDIKNNVKSKKDEITLNTMGASDSLQGRLTVDHDNNDNTATFSN